MDSRVALSSQLIDTDTTSVGEIIDIKGFESIEFIVSNDEQVTNGDYAILLEEGDDVNLSDAGVLDLDLTLGSLDGYSPMVIVSTHIRVGSIGKKRYQRLSLVSTNTSAGVAFSGVAILGNPHTSQILLYQ